MKTITRVGTVLTAAVLLSSTALAMDRPPANWRQSLNGGAMNGGAANAGSVNGGTSVPEIDAAGATLAFALMGGFVAIVRERRRRRSR